jgi:dTDP-4-dehydrorhamnose reductase
LTVSGLELWGGVECTLNRVDDVFRDQCVLSGHEERISDFRRFAELGVKALRFPVLWERVEPTRGQYDWSWPDRGLAALRDLGIRPIVGLVHHGSGPRHAVFDGNAFVPGLADFAARVAERYPWIEDYTPVNEPLTTARFSGLYGFWHPHGRDNSTFLRILTAEVMGIAGAMREVKRVVPHARLVQTEDLGWTFSTPGLSYQAELENSRRWLGFDLLFGRVGPDHPWFESFSIAGARGAVAALHAEPCPPDIVGLNYYLSSERMIDDRLSLYPEPLRGGNGKHAYADIEAVRVLLNGPAGPEALIAEAWRRFGKTVALTEVHNGCTRDEQMRWFAEMWEVSERLRSSGVDLCAITAWSLLGSFDWNSMLTKRDGHYEPGVFDIRSPEPRATAMVPLLKSFSAGRPVDHPVLDTQGWWHRPERLTIEAFDAGPCTWRAPPACPHPRRILIIGANGTLGRAFAYVCRARGLSFELLSRQQMDIADAVWVKQVLEDRQPWAVINAAGFVRVDEAEDRDADCQRDNCAGAVTVALACEERGIPIITFSSDLVFDGRKRSPYLESDPVAPLSAYGRSKAEAERAVLAAGRRALVIRCAAFFGPWDAHNFAEGVCRSLAAGTPVMAAADQIVSPTYVPDLVNTSLDLLIDGEAGLWHLANEGEVSWSEFARKISGALNITGQVVEEDQLSLRLAAPRPCYSALGTERGRLMPSLDSAIERFVRDRITS